MARARLPPLNAIKAFEAAARLGSFTRAAEELSVTHGAVSRQIRMLEDWLGTKLFLRTSRRAVPTPAGTDLFAEAEPALDRLATAALRLRGGVQALRTLSERQDYVHAYLGRFAHREGSSPGMDQQDRSRNPGNWRNKDSGFRSSTWFV